LVLAAIIALIVAVLPVQAGAGGATTGLNPVHPYEINLGGQPDDCDATISTTLDDGGNPEGSYPGLGSPAANSFRIVNLSDGVAVGGGWIQHTDPIGGLVIEVNPNQGGKTFDFRVDSGGSIADVIVNGGSNSTHFIYSRDIVDPGSPAVVERAGAHETSDEGLHAPNKGRGGLTNYFSTSHAEFCYDTFATISGKVFHDNDQDGVQDDGTPDPGPPVEQNPVEPGQLGWTVRVYSNGTLVASTTPPLPGGTDANGSYSIPNVPVGTYTICQEAPSGQWGQTDVGGTWDPSKCGNSSEENGGHVITLSGDATVNFGNFMTVTKGCGDAIPDPTGEHSITLPTEASGLCDKDSDPNTPGLQPAEFVLETYIRGSGAGAEQVHDFHAIEPVTGNAHVTEVHVWSIDQIQNSSTLMYDDGKGAGTQTALYCNHDPTTGGVLDANKVPPLGANPLPAGHTTCIITSTEGPNAAGNDTRTDTLYSLIDGRRWM
jgi:hypothetical protein